MNFVLRHSGSSESEIELPKGKAVLIGYDERSCFRLISYYRTNDITVQVLHTGDGCVAENLSRNPNYVQLNGNPLTSIARLESGDVLQIGLDQIEISTRVAIEVAARDTVESPVKPVPVDYSVKTTFANSAVSIYGPVDGRWSEVNVHEHVAKNNECIILANFRAAEEAQWDSEIIGTDMLENAPVEVTSIYSLHAVNDAPAEEKLKLLKTLWQKDAVMVIFPEQDPQDFIKAIKLYLGWLARPSVLEMTLTRGSRQLCESIMQPVKAAVFKPKSSPFTWSVCSKPGLEKDQLADMLHETQLLIK